MLVVPADGRPGLVAPRLEAMAAAAARPARRAWSRSSPWDETDDPYAPRRRAARRQGRRIAPARRPGAPGAPSPGAPGARCPESPFGLATEVTRTLRMVKGADEIELLRRAAHAADRVVAQIAAGRLVGRTEADVSREVRERLVAEGHEAAPFAIVASGPNGASPHHEASERVIEPGDPIVLDIGGTLEGYGSDITRMLWVTGGDPSRGPDAGVPRGLRPGPSRPGRGDRGRPARRSLRATSTRSRAASSATAATATRSSTGSATGSGWRGTRSRISSPATPSRCARASPSASSRASTSPAGSACASRTSSSAAPDGPDVLNGAPRDLLVVAG